MKARNLPSTLSLLMFPFTSANQNHSTTEAVNKPEIKPISDVIDIAAECEQLSTLMAALNAADLIHSLRQDGPFTVFAPNNAAFAKLSPNAVETLLTNKKMLTQMLMHHVVSGQLMAADISTQDSAPTLRGRPLAINTANELRIDDAALVTTDLVAINGVVHIIDTVLSPH